ncbi:MAG: ATP-binding protein [Candidatus Micrarchaeia archaeon]
MDEDIGEGSPIIGGKKTISLNISKEVSLDEAVQELHNSVKEKTIPWSMSKDFAPNAIIIFLWAFIGFLLLISTSSFVGFATQFIFPGYYNAALIVFVLFILYFIIGIAIPVLLFRANYYSKVLNNSKLNKIKNNINNIKEGIFLGVAYKHKLDVPHYLENNNEYKSMQFTKTVVDVGEYEPYVIDYLKEPNYNILNIGSSGFGKSVTSMSFAVRASLNYGIKFLIIDYNGEYEKFSDKCNLTAWHAGKNFKINLFKLNGVDPETRASFVSDTLVATAKLTPLQATKVKSALMYYYRMKKIPRLLDIFIDLSKNSKNELICQRLRAIQRVIGKEPKEFWTSILNTNNIVNLAGLNETEKELAVHMILERIYELFNREQELNSKLRLLVIIDEAWRATHKGRYDSDEYEPLVSRIARQGRKYGFGIMLTTQQLSDAPGPFINSSAIKFIHNYQDSDTLNSMARLFKLSVFESTYIENANIGEALVINKGRKIAKSQWWNDYVKIHPLEEEEFAKLAAQNQRYIPKVIDEPSMPIDAYENGSYK